MAALQGAVWFPLFTASSVAMVVLNKYCAAAFPLPYSLLLFQNAVTVALNAAFVQVPRWRVRVCARVRAWVRARARVSGCPPPPGPRPHRGQPWPAARRAGRVRVPVECLRCCVFCLAQHACLRLLSTRVGTCAAACAQRVMMICLPDETRMTDSSGRHAIRSRIQPVSSGCQMRHA